MARSSLRSGSSVQDEFDCEGPRGIEMQGPVGVRRESQGEGGCGQPFLSCKEKA